MIRTISAKLLQLFLFAGTLIITPEHFIIQRMVLFKSMVATVALWSLYPFVRHSRAAFVENLVLRPPVDTHNTAERQ
ncbi:hypothetical protein HBI56_203000 [Parastagonospora nodorum]|uniref:Uncharacterized protein n=1 Tax=Phaeosphaeria nodorum (strain SN15 / ATCC MYA-4574 / FGSC 10173) TaxID=321614 RepID=A0A7U2FA32_PHANO|nr:hypothetical protein HBH56_143080 [Parastagonospora nodorum]QRD01516.1 hypothetical protein JI435_416870 [Parastagonospora nodorum SN15]KAH3927874.1 hypothetical protein HBH54_148270 [Parastagonospora nodorum]KAH3947789.1 hypothetical protein HBH53_108310 [Parastagonospora nodorum]KAH3962007.1 hypothetical protein HBH51_178710 [Parastagonospora nodorum]